jgi:hypothetical protein
MKDEMFVHLIPVVGVLGVVAILALGEKDARERVRSAPVECSRRVLDGLECLVCERADDPQTFAVTCRWPDEDRGGAR